MSGLSLSVNSIDRLNQATALLGGATAQSYSAGNGMSAPQFSGLMNRALDWYAQHVNQSSLDPSLDANKPVLDIPQGEPLVLSLNSLTAQLVFSENQGNISVSINEETKPDSDLLSRFPEFDQDNTSVGSAGELNQSDAVEAAELMSDDIGEGLLLSSFLDEIIEQAQDSNPEFDGAFDGGNQGAISFQPIGSLAPPELGPLIVNSRDELFGILG